MKESKGRITSQMSRREKEMVLESYKQRCKAALQILRIVGEFKPAVLISEKALFMKQSLAAAMRPDVDFLMFREAIQAFELIVLQQAQEKQNEGTEGMG